LGWSWESLAFTLELYAAKLNFTDRHGVEEDGTRVWEEYACNTATNANFVIKPIRNLSTPVYSKALYF